MFEISCAKAALVAARWPALERWFVAIESELPAYSEQVMGDTYSWSALVGTFQRMFSSNATEGDPGYDPERAAKAVRQPATNSDPLRLAMSPR